MAAADWRRRSAEFQDPLLSRNLALRDALQPIASRYGVGARSPEQVDGWISAGRLRLDAADLAEIASALERTQAGSGPTKPVAVDDGGGSWLDHGLDPSSLEGAIARMVLPANR
jgi:aryl-alcohol dehydrogenase-like predicted oxidoreductase